MWPGIGGRKPGSTIRTGASQGWSASRARSWRTSWAQWSILPWWAEWPLCFQQKHCPLVCQISLRMFLFHSKADSWHDLTQYWSLDQSKQNFFVGKKEKKKIKSCSRQSPWEAGWPLKVSIKGLNTHSHDPRRGTKATPGQYRGPP